jgi:hypothetical protein
MRTIICIKAMFLYKMRYINGDDVESHGLTVALGGTKPHLKNIRDFVGKG